MEFLILMFGIVTGALVLYVILIPKMKSSQQIDYDTVLKNEELQNKLLKLTEEQSLLLKQKEEISLEIESLQEQVKESSENLYKKSYEIANEKMNRAAETLSQKYNEAKELADKEYIKTIEEYSNLFQKQIKEKQDELNDINFKLIDLTAKFNAATEANKRKMEQQNKENFYRLQLSQTDIEEIKHLRSITPYLRNSEPLNKVIWKVYYEKPYTDLIGRVVGTGIHTGIYKITNIENQMCYIGQAINIADRFKQHIKRGIGADPPTRNKLYPAMLEKGVENFLFEIIEECDRSKLNEREQYWQEFFHAKDFGYSIK